MGVLAARGTRLYQPAIKTSISEYASRRSVAPSYVQYDSVVYPFLHEFGNAMVAVLEPVGGIFNGSAFIICVLWIGQLSRLVVRQSPKTSVANLVKSGELRWVGDRHSGVRAEEVKTIGLLIRRDGNWPDLP